MMSMPQAQCVAQAAELARPCKNVMDYLAATLKAKVAKDRSEEEYSPVLKAVEESVKIADMRDKFLNEISQKTWTATASPVDLEKIKPNSGDYLMVPAIEGIQEINKSLGKDQKVSDIVMVYYIDENAQFNRGYVVNNQIVDENNADHKKMMQVLDQIFHSWLVSNNFASDANGMIFWRKKNGDLAEKADPNQVVELLNNPDTGFQNTVEKVDPSIRLQILWTPPDIIPEEAPRPQNAEELALTQSSRGKGG